MDKFEMLKNTIINILTENHVSEIKSNNLSYSITKIQETKNFVELNNFVFHKFIIQNWYDLLNKQSNKDDKLLDTILKIVSKLKHPRLNNIEREDRYAFYFIIADIELNDSDSNKLARIFEMFDLRSLGVENNLNQYDLKQLVKIINKYFIEQ